MSGGPDSVALLALAVAAGLRATAWYVEHGLRAGSDASYAEAAAAAVGAEFRVVAVDVGHGPNLEDRARTARYAALPEPVATGHTADDQAETVLLALLRGAGLDGLSGMAAEHPGRLRPILGLRRAETRALCAALGLAVAADPTNNDPAFRRNRVRHELLPLAAEVAGRDVVPLIARSAALLRADGVWLAAAAAELDPTDARALASAPPAAARRAVRAWLVGATPAGTPPYAPSAAAVERVLAVARGEAVGCEVAGVGRIVRSRQRLVILGVTP